MTTRQVMTELYCPYDAALLFCSPWRAVQICPSCRRETNMLTGAELRDVIRQPYE